MRLILVDRQTPKRYHFYPLALSRPIWELRCGMTTLGEKLVARLRPNEVACFVPPYMAAAYRRQTSWPVNDPKSLQGDDLLLVNPRLKAVPKDLATAGPSQMVCDADGEMLCARIAASDVANLPADSIDSLLDSAAQRFPRDSATDVPAWNYTWELVLANSRQLIDDYAEAGRSGIEGTVEQPSGVRGSPRDIYIARGAKIHPMVVLDTEHGPITIDEEAEVYPFTRVEGPCYVGPRSLLLGAKCRAGSSIGPMCRIGGEIEESIVQGYSNKYHDGFLGHAYVGQWVNLGALTTNSDLKNDYSSVAMILDGSTSIDTGSTKVGSLIGDHAKTSIGTLLNTGSYVGAMTLLVGSGGLLPKFIPSFTWYLKNTITPGAGKDRLCATAKIVMARRHCEWTEADDALWDGVFAITAPKRDNVIARSLRR